MIRCCARRLSRRTFQGGPARAGVHRRTGRRRKQDCERDAVKRWLMERGARLKPLRPVYMADDLFACRAWSGGFGRGDDFLFTCKEAWPRALYDFIDGAELRGMRSKSAKARRARRIATVREKVPLRDGEDAVSSAGSLDSLNAKGEVLYRTGFVASRPVAKRIVHEIAAAAAQGGRSGTKAWTS